MTQRQIAIVADTPHVEAELRDCLEEEGVGLVKLDPRGSQPPALLPHAVLLQVESLQAELHERLALIRGALGPRPVVVVVPEGERAAVEFAIAAGAFDYIEYPFRAERVRLSVTHAADKQTLSEELDRLSSQIESQRRGAQIVGQSAMINEVTRQVERLADSSLPVTLLGPRGTGKEYAARALHSTGVRATGPFVTARCRALRELVHESQLIGSERNGAAVERGLLEQAAGGTLYLEGIDALDPIAQSRLLDVLERRALVRLGGAQPQSLSCRIVCSSSEDLSELVRRGRFLEDLYIRVAGCCIRLPSLEDRRADIPLLVSHFLKKHRDTVDREIRRVSPGAMEVLVRTRYAENVRELESVVQRAMLSADGDSIETEDLPIELRERDRSTTPMRDIDVPILPLRELERRAIQAALRATDGSVQQAAKLLGVGRATLYRRLANDGAIMREHV